MIVYLIISAGFWLSTLYIYGLKHGAIYNNLLHFSLSYQSTLFTWSFVISLLLLFGSRLLRQAGWLSLLFYLSKTVLALNEFIIAFTSVSALVLWFELKKNLWSDLGTFMIIPAVFLIITAYCLYIFDFNFPLSNRMKRDAALPVLSLLIIFLSNNFF